MADSPSISDAATACLQAGLCVLPAIRAEKRPAVGRWKQYQTRLPSPAELSAWLANDPEAICIICGQASGHLEMIDFDAGGELFEVWSQAIPAELLERLVIERSPSGGWHVIYRCTSPVCGNLKLAQRMNGDGVITLIETRGEGGLFLCAPTDGYAITQGDLCGLPVLTEDERDILLQAAWDLNECPPQSGIVGQRSALCVGQGEISADISNNGGCATDDADNSGGGHGAADHSHIGPISANHSDIREGASHHADRPGDDFNIRGDVRAVLEHHGWVRIRSGENEHWRRPGKDSGTSATLKDRVFYVFSSNAAPFEPNQAYAPFSVYTLLEHGGDFEQAARSLRERGYGGDPRNDAADNGEGVDISAIVRMSIAPGEQSADHSHISEGAADHADIGDGAADNADPGDPGDPGPTPEHLLHIPGFVGEVVDFCMAGAPYPSLGMAFCGALAMQAHLCGRKVREPGDLRTNVYLLALASSSAGKNYPRQINGHLAIAGNLVETLRRKFSSGEGIEDRLEAHPCSFYQTDEIDGILQAVARSKDARHESIISVLLELYSSSNMMYAMRSKAGKQSAGIIHQPHLTIFGTATPGHYYEAMSERMLTNGFFARMIIVDTGKRSPGQDAVPVDEMPQRPVETAKWWASFQPGEHRGNLVGFFPKPITVGYTNQAKRIADEFRDAADQHYSDAEDRGDEVAMTVWGRANENARKLALLYACSENHGDPQITRPAVEWASAFVEHQVRRMLFMAGQYVSATEFEGECKKAMRFLRRRRDNGRPQDYPTPDWWLRRHMALSPTAYDSVIEALIKQQRIEFRSEPGATKPRTGWVLR